jgi:hypothetical protein
VFESFDLPAICGAAPLAMGSPLLEEDAESPASAWTASGLWHRSSRRAASGGFSWWYGRESDASYETGGRNRGSLNSPRIDLEDSAGAILEWDQLLRSEGFGHPMELEGYFGPYLNADSGRLLLSVDGGSSWTVLSHIAHATPGPGFASYRVNLSRFAGRTIRLRFDFDTFDGEDNAHEGWYLDNIRVVRLGPDPARLHFDAASLSFSAAAGGPSPPARPIRVSTTGGNAAEELVWTATVVKGASWLALLPASGRTPTVVQVSVSALGLAAGVHEGEVRFCDLSRSETVGTIGVTLIVQATPGRRGPIHLRREAGARE